MLDRMAVPVLTSSDTDDIVVSNSTCPHYICTCIIVVGLCDSTGSFLYHSQENSFAETVCYLDFTGICEVTLENVSHNICSSAGCLISRERTGKLGIEDREAGAEQIGAYITLQAALFLCYNRSSRTLTACRSDSQDSTNGESLFDLLACTVEVPEISFIGNAQSDSLRGVYT